MRVDTEPGLASQSDDCLFSLALSFMPRPKVEILLLYYCKWLESTKRQYAILHSELRELSTQVYEFLVALLRLSLGLACCKHLIRTNSE